MQVRFSIHLIVTICQLLTFASAVARGSGFVSQQVQRRAPHPLGAARLPRDHQIQVEVDLTVYRNVAEARLKSFDDFDPASSFDAFQNLGCSATRMLVWAASSGGVELQSCRAPETLEAPLSLPFSLVDGGQISPVAKAFLDQPHAPLLPELRHSRNFSKLITRTEFVTINYPVDVDMSSQNFPASRALTTTRIPTPVPGAHYSRVSSRLSSIVAELSTALKSPSSTRTVPIVTVNSAGFTPKPLSERAAIWASQFPHLFATTTLPATATATVSYTLRSSSVTTTTLTPFFEGDPTPTITQYSVWFVDNQGHRVTSSAGSGVGDDDDDRNDRISGVGTPNQDEGNDGISMYRRDASPAWVISLVVLWHLGVV